MRNKRAHKFKNQKKIDVAAISPWQALLPTNPHSVRCSLFACRFIITITATLCRELATTYTYNSNSNYLCSGYIACKLASTARMHRKSMKGEARGGAAVGSPSTAGRNPFQSVLSKPKTAATPAAGSGGANKGASLRRAGGNQTQIALACVDLIFHGCNLTRSRFCTASINGDYSYLMVNCNNVGRWLIFFLPSGLVVSCAAHATFATLCASRERRGEHQAWETSAGRSSA